jgi:hypothetical protein
MLKAHLLEDLTGTDAASCAAAAVTATATWWSLIGDAAAQLLGVQLSVALAAATGAFLARTYQAAAPLLHAVVGSACWVVGACALAPLAAPLAEKYGGLTLPAGVLAGAAFAIAIGGPLALQLGVGFVRRKFGGAPPEAASAVPSSDSKGTP